MTPDKTVCYKTVGARQLLADIYLPPVKLDGRSPVLFYYHGGGWFAGDRAEPAWLPLMLGAVTAAGITVISVEYRLCVGGVTADMLLGDCADAVRFFTRQAQDYNLDSSRVMTGGISAGAHISMLLPFAARLFGDDADRSDALPYFRAICSMSGLTDLRANLDTEDKSGIRMCYRALLGKDEKLWDAGFERLSPLSYVRALPENTELPALLCVHGELDSIVRPDQPQLMRAEYEARVGDFSLLLVHNAHHTFGALPGYPPPELTLEEIQRLIAAFAIGKI